MSSEMPHLFIFSKGRIGKQKTLNYIPDWIQKEHLTFVTPKSEIAQHKSQPYGKNLNYLGAPENIHLADKRYRVVEKFYNDGGRRFMMLDDDLRLSAVIRSKEPQDQAKHVSMRTEEGQDIFSRIFSKRIPKLFDNYDSIGAACRYFAPEHIAKHGFIKENTKCCNFFGYDAEKLLNLLPQPALKEIWGLDTTWNLATLQAGQTNVSFYDVLWDTEFATEKCPGGANLYRNTAAVNQSFLRMMVLFPGLISRGREGIHHSSFLKINWIKAAECGNYDGQTEDGKEKFLVELAHQGIDTSEFIARLPELSQYYYSKRLRKLDW